MPTRPDPTPSAAHAEEGAVIRAAEFKALQRLSKLTESENERVALRASEVVLRYAAQRRRAEGRSTPAPAALSSPAGGLRPPPAEVKKIPHALLHPPAPAPAFRAVPAGAHFFDPPSVPPVLSNT